MCGIAGIASSRGRVDPALVTRMRDTMVHRGPDDAGAWASADGRVQLAQRRLAIIDLSPGGHQPMTDASGDLTVTFNGEVYNFMELRRELEGLGHSFRSRSDTEVLLEAYREWGDECLAKLNGMFAFALHDGRRRRVLLVRDRAGEKPLFVRMVDGTIAFASELKALLADPACPRNLEPEALGFYLAYGYVPWDWCLLKGVKKLPQGHALAFDLDSGESKRWAYWSLPQHAAPESWRSEEFVDELETLLADSVRLRLISDVPVGILLSGGIDSSLVTALAARASSRPVKTFTISFPGHPEYDESAHARVVADHFGTDHTELPAEEATLDLLPLLARQYDEPIGDSSLLPTYLVSRLIRQHATVALGGDGGDELFGGYGHYEWIRRHDKVRRQIPRALRRVIGKGVSKYSPVGVRGRNYLIGLEGDLSWSIAHIGLYFDVASRRRLLAPELRKGPAGQPIPETFRATLSADRPSLLQRVTALDFRTYLVDDILVKVDRASMLTSLEVRAPWLDPRIIEMAFGRTPDSLRAGNGQKKILPRMLARKLLPAALDLDRKQGFGVPLARWFKGDWGPFFEDVLSGMDPAMFDRSFVQKLIRGQRRGLVNIQRLFALVMLELWRREYGISA